MQTHPGSVRLAGAEEHHRNRRLRQRPVAHVSDDADNLVGNAAVPAGECPADGVSLPERAGHRVVDQGDHRRPIPVRRARNSRPWSTGMPSSPKYPAPTTLTSTLGVAPRAAGQLDLGRDVRAVERHEGRTPRADPGRPATDSTAVRRTGRGRRVSRRSSKIDRYGEHLRGGIQVPRTPRPRAAEHQQRPAISTTEDRHLGDDEAVTRRIQEAGGFGAPATRP